MRLERDPGAGSGVIDFVRLEAGFVFERRAACDVVAQVDVRELNFLSLGDEGENVKGAEGTEAVIGIVEEIDSGKAGRKSINVADSHQILLEVVAPLFGGKRIV